MIKTYIGPMFSGKSTALVNDYMNIWNKENVMCFKPSIDVRDLGVIKTRNIKTPIKAICIESIDEINHYLKKNTKTIFIDEAHFLSGDISSLVKISLDRDIDIHIAGLNMTSDQNPFGLMPQILAVSNEIKIFDAVCYDCNREAQFIFYSGDKKGDVLIGDDGYMPLCSKCLMERKKVADRL